MALQLVKLDDGTLPGIADAIRAKTGGTALLLPSEMAAAIEAIPTGTDLPYMSIPASDGDVLNGKEYIDGNGTKKTGTLVICDNLMLYAHGQAGVGLLVYVESEIDWSTNNLKVAEENLVSENIKSGIRIFGVAGSAKTLTVETGTITPAEDVIDITIPAPFDGYCALVLTASDSGALEAHGANSTYSVRVIRAMDDGIGSIGVINRYNGSTYSASTTLPQKDDNGNIYIINGTGRYFRAGITYNYYVYYWGDAA